MLKLLVLLLLKSVCGKDGDKKQRNRRTKRDLIDRFPNVRGSDDAQRLAPSMIPYVEPKRESTLPQRPPPPPPTHDTESDSVSDSEGDDGEFLTRIRQCRVTAAMNRLKALNSRLLGGMRTGETAFVLVNERHRRYGINVVSLYNRLGYNVATACTDFGISQWIARVDTCTREARMVYTTNGRYILSCNL